MCGDTEAPFDSSFDSSFNSFTLCPGFDTDYLGFPPPESNAPNVTYMNIQPTDKDVLFRCGEGVNRHPGNVRFRKEVTKHKEIYRSCINKRQKAEYIIKFLTHIHKSDARFLDFDKGAKIWYVVHKRRAKDKCGQALRE